MIISTPEAMIEFGKEMSQKATHILLYGDLGAGKTHFVKGYVAGLGIDPYQVQSPTYTYFHSYDNKVLHMDMYRLESEDFFIKKGILQAMQEYPYILIEWPKFEHLYVDGYMSIKIDKISPTERKVSIAY